MRLTQILLAGFVVSLLGTTCALAAEKPGIPTKALKEMGYRVGKWQSELYVDGVKQAEAMPETVPKGDHT